LAFPSARYQLINPDGDVVQATNGDELGPEFCEFRTPAVEELNKLKPKSRPSLFLLWVTIGTMSAPTKSKAESIGSDLRTAANRA
jgi:hypothetical protein